MDPSHALQAAGGVPDGMTGGVPSAALRRRALETLAVVLIAVVLPAGLSGVHAGAQDHDGHQAADVLGHVDFPVSCLPEAQRRFNTAAALLYSFYWEKIDAAIDDVLAADPGCAMAHWARAVASLDNALGSPPTPAQEQRGWDAVQAALRTGARTARERDYIAAVEVVFRDHATVPFAMRAKAYGDALEQLHRRYPDDAEAAILHAFWLQVTADRNDQTYSQQLRSAKILEDLLPRHPDHPGIAHFLIHAYDFPAIASQGLDAARRYAAIAPDAPHALHMPSHIFSRVGLWRQSLDANVRSHAASTTSRDAYHAMDYMVYALLQIADDARARAWVDIVEADAGPGEEARQVAYAGAAIPARYALERGDWQAASRLALHPARGRIDWSRFPEGEAVNAYARGLGAARRGDVAGAHAELGRLRALRTAMAAQAKDYWVKQADIQLGAIAAWIARAEGRDADALAGMHATADLEDATEEHIMMPGRIIPVREMLGELLLDLDRPGLALAAFEQSLVDDPNRFRSIHGAARAAELGGDRGRAGDLYRRLLSQVGPAAGRAEIEAARAFKVERRGAQEPVR